MTPKLQRRVNCGHVDFTAVRCDNGDSSITEKPADYSLLQLDFLDSIQADFFGFAGYPTGFEHEAAIGDDNFRCPLLNHHDDEHPQADECDAQYKQPEGSNHCMGPMEFGIEENSFAALQSFTNVAHA